MSLLLIFNMDPSSVIISLHVRARRHFPGEGGGALYGDIVFRWVAVPGFVGILKLKVR